MSARRASVRQLELVRVKSNKLWSEAGAITRTLSLLPLTLVGFVRHCFTAIYGSPVPTRLVRRSNFVAEWPCFLIAR